MKLITDLHIHSHYSRATSKNLDFPHLAEWAMRKGVDLLVTGDVAHPGWLAEMHENLQPAGGDLFELKPEILREVLRRVPKACHREVRFLLGGEISNIYKKYDRVRKIHNMVYLPTLDAVEKFQVALEKIGNIRSDGRPILGLDSRDLLEILLDTDARGHFIPAHIWTPWFALFGSKSGFDAIEDCFNDLTPHIFALETGLSSDPPMNWRLSALDNYTLVSHSDAHSPQKLAREANILNCDLSYDAVFAAIKSGRAPDFLGTIEFFPEEGKYHYDGHRKCEIRWEPAETKTHGGKCPVCGKPVTVGVTHRVDDLADRPVGYLPENRPPFYSLVPLAEVLSEVHSVGAGSKKVNTQYEKLLNKVGPELFILQDAPLEEVARAGGERLAEGIARMRSGNLRIEAGYDGEFGVIRLFDNEKSPGVFPQFNFGEKGDEKLQVGSGTLKDNPETTIQKPQSKLQNLPSKIQNPESSNHESLKSTIHHPPSTIQKPETSLNPAQAAAVQCTDVPLVIVAGPGTGKTRTLTHRIAYLVQEKSVAPESILAITFTNKAAQEMRERLAKLLSAEIAERLTVLTFHALGALILREQHTAVGLPEHFSILSESERALVFTQCFPALSNHQRSRYLAAISDAKQQLLAPGNDKLNSILPDAVDFPAVYREYQKALRSNAAVDFDDLLLQPILLLEASPAVLVSYQHRFRWISVDEYQDVNAAQYRLLRLLTGGGSNLCVIGDPDQAIYGFRGADRRYFLQFADDFPSARQINLSQNYRSAQPIISASSQVIAREGSDSGRGLFSEIVSQTKVEIYEAPTEKAEAEYIVHSIERMVGGTSYFSLDSGRVADDGSGRSFADFAVLYRLGAQAEALEEAFARSGIPYQTIGQTPFFEQPGIKQALAHLQFLQNPASLLHFQQMMGEPLPLPGGELLRQISGDPQDAVSQFAAFASWCKLSVEQRHRLPQIIDFMKNTGVNKVSPITAVLENLPLPEATLDAEQRRKLRYLAAPFGENVKAFLEHVAMHKEADTIDSRADRVPLLTIHAAKGLEFPVVFIIGCEENLLPYRRFSQAADVDEERRLFYVGMTRAQETLVLTRAKSRRMFGEQRQNAPSRFLGDIENALKELKASDYHKKNRKPETPADNGQMSLFD